MKFSEKLAMVVYKKKSTFIYFCLFITALLHLFVKFEPVQIPYPIRKLNLRSFIAFLASLTLLKLKIYSNKGALTKKEKLLTVSKEFRN